LKRTSRKRKRDRQIGPQKAIGPDKSRQFKAGDKIRINLHHGKIEDAVVRAVIRHVDGIKLQVDVVGLDLTAVIDTWQVV
jgi:hypothetical protein